MNTQLGRWGYFKNIKRGQAFAIIRERNRRMTEGKDSDFTIQSRPVDLRKVERHCQRAGFSIKATQCKWHESVSTEVTCRTPPPTTSIGFMREEQWRVPEKLLFDVDHFIKGSFEAGLWTWSDQFTILHSSDDQGNEPMLLYSVKNDLISGWGAAEVKDFVLAGSFWANAFQNVDNLVRGQYPATIVDLVRVINDLNQRSGQKLARMLQQHIMACCQVFLKPGSATFSIYDGLERLEMTHMIDVEERIMKRFHELYEVYLGPAKYDSFIMAIEYARRRLHWDECIQLEDVLPPVDVLDRTYGISDNRSLIVISIRIEIAGERGWLEQVETESSILIQRAGLILDDNWMRIYYLTIGWFHLGYAQYYLGKDELAITSFNNALAIDEESRRAINMSFLGGTTITLYLLTLQSRH
jgi:hypothetical protein